MMLDYSLYCVHFLDLLAKINIQGIHCVRRAFLFLVDLLFQVIFGVMKKVEAPISGKSGQRISSPHYPTSYKEWAEFQLSEQVSLPYTHTHIHMYMHVHTHKQRTYSSTCIHPNTTQVVQVYITISCIIYFCCVCRLWHT